MEHDKITTYLIIEHKSDEKYLMQKMHNGWTLPKINGGAERQYMVAPIQQAARQQLEMNLRIGRKLYRKNHEPQNNMVKLYEAEISDSQYVSADFKWGDKDDIASLILDDEEIRTAITKKVEGKWVSEKTASWFRKGWYDRVEKWIASAANRNGYTLNGTIEQVKVSDLSLILRIPSTDGALYFKAAGPAARYEAKLSQHLDRVHKGRSVEVVDINENEGWLLMRELGGGSLRLIRDKQVWQRAIHEYAKLQVSEAAYVDKLISMGLPDRRLHILREDIEKHLAGMCATGLDEDATQKVMALKPELLKMCDEMEGVVPDTIDHGDLHSANIHLVDEDIVFFDWGDATITHPFFSTRVFWNFLDELAASDSEWLDMVNEFKAYYLEPWTRFAPIQQLERLLLISDQLSCVYRALSWYLYITPSRENKEDSFKKPSQWLEVLLEHRELIGIK